MRTSRQGEEVTVALGHVQHALAFCSFYGLHLVWRTALWSRARMCTSLVPSCHRLPALVHVRSIRSMNYRRYCTEIRL